jgi:ribose transport system substrate-binding protein
LDVETIGANSKRRAVGRAIEFYFLSTATTALLITPPSFAEAPGSLIEQAKQLVAAASEPQTKAPDLPGIDVGARLKSKSIFYLSAGLSYAFSQEVLKGVQDASAALGMTVVTADASTGSSSASGYIDRATSQGAAAIVLQGVDAYTVEASLADARAAHIPVVTVAALPPGRLPKEIVDLGVSASVNFSVAEVGKVMAAYVAANATPDAHVALISCSTFRTDEIVAKEFTAELKRLCPGCVLTTRDSPLTQWQTTLPLLVRTLITVDPAITFIVPSVDAMVPSIKPAILAVGAGDKIKIVSNNAQLPDMQAIATKKDQEVADVGASIERMGWATVDQIARLLTGHQPVTDDQPLRLFTTENIDEVNLKKPSYTWYGPFDFKSYYRKLWGL